MRPPRPPHRPPGVLGVVSLSGPLLVPLPLVLVLLPLHRKGPQVMTSFPVLLGLAAVVWPVQYLLVSPTVWLWRVCVTGLRAGLKMGVLGILLILLPVIGWVILGAISMHRSSQRRADQRHAETLAALGHVQAPATAPRSLWTPWGLSLLTA